MTFPQEPLRFLQALYPSGVPDASLLYIWTLPGRASTYFNDLGAMSVQAGSKSKLDVYFGAGLAPMGLGRSDRAKADQVLGIPGLWVDLDFADPAHKKQNLPVEAEGKAFLATIEPQPTIVVHSGHGLQAWWCFEETWLFSDEGDRKLAASISQAWTYSIRDLVRAKGWDLDATFDLSRVMRVPGTVNNKGSMPVPVTVLSYGDIRWPHEQWAERLESALVALPAAPPAAAKTDQATLPAGYAPATPPTSTGDPLRLDPAAVPPFDKWAALQETNPKIGKTWARERAEYPDQSPSSYDMALSSYTVAAGWSDQEITDLLIACRRRWKDDLKLREDYYMRTIRQARLTVQSVLTDDAEMDALDKPTDFLPPIVEPTPHDPVKALAILSGTFGATIVKLVKYLGDPPNYVLVLEKDGTEQSITLGNVDVILTQRMFRSKVAASINLIVPKCSETQWEKRAQTLLNCMVEEDLGPESTPAGIVRAWISDYIETHHARDNAEEAAPIGAPYWTGGMLHLSLRSLGSWLRTTEGERINQRELARYLKMAAFEQYTQNITVDGSPTSRSVWRGKF